jgi:hypothetical protein
MWNRAPEGSAVAGYEVYQDGEKVHDLPAEEYMVDVVRLEPSTTYSFTVRAVDDGGRRSADSRPVSVTTLSADTDDEEAEYEAMYAAAEESLRLLGQAPDAPRRRVVLAANLADHLIEEEDRHGPDVIRVRITGESIPYKRLASAHIDDEAAASDIAKAVADPDSGAADDHELMWYALQELRHLLT